MKNIKDITLSIFAVIGFVAILSSFNNQTQQQVHGTPESHVWEFHIPTETLLSASTAAPAYAINKATGEVRKYDGSDLDINRDGGISDEGDVKYAVMVEAK